MSEKLSDVVIEGDKLDAIFDAQGTFRKNLGKGKDAIIDLMSENEKGERLMGLIHAMEDELAELKATVYWKWWAKEGKDPKTKYTFRKDAKMPNGRENAKEELADILCFLGDMCACVGLTAEDLAKINIRKTRINIERQQNNYSMAGKTGEDSEKLWKEIEEGDK